MIHRIPAVLFTMVLAFVAASVAAAEAGAPPDDGAILLVASPRLVTPAYYHTVVLATPLAGGRHVGFIVNRPTEVSLSSLFPEHAPSAKVIDPVFFGGPMSMGAVFAVVRDPRNPGGGSITVMEDLQMVMRADLIDRIIEAKPNDARYFVGMIRWSPGELDQELRRGFWHVLNPDASLVFRKETGRLWEELLRQARSTTSASLVVRVLSN